MFKGNRKYYMVLAIIFIAVVLLHYFKPEPVNWSRTYNKADKIPFGCYAIFNLLEGTYAESVEVNSQDLYNLNESTLTSGQTLLIINDKAMFSKLELESLFAFLEKGNTVLISANSFNSVLCDTFKLRLQENTNFGTSSFDSLINKPAFEIGYVQPKNNIEKSYRYPAIASESYFSEIDTGRFTIIAQNKKQMPVLLEASIGKGKLLLSSLPDIFGNLFIVQNDNRNYVYTLLSKLKNRTMIWDEYYKTYGGPKQSVFSFIFSSDALYMAYCIAILGLLIFMAFEIKRRQRFIAVITPLKNSTLEFVDVVSHVYFNTHNHKHIAEETIKYFYFDIYKKFHLSTASLDETFYKALHNLSGIDIDKIKALFSYCENLRHAPGLTQYDLLELNDRITNFKKQSMR